MGGRCEGLGASFAAYYAHGLGCESWPDTDCARHILGADGLCHDRWHSRRHSTDAAVLPGSLCGLLQDQGAKGGLRSPGDRACRLSLNGVAPALPLDLETPPDEGEPARQWGPTGAFKLLREF